MREDAAHRNLFLEQFQRSEQCVVSVLELRKWESRPEQTSTASSDVVALVEDAVISGQPKKGKVA
jgi:hypothetical protein